MPVTPEDIANMALGVLDEAPIDSLEDDNKAARLCNLHYELTREAELTKHIWSFASFFPSAITAVDAGEDVPSQFRYLYEVPSDFLRPCWITHDGTPDGIPITYSMWADGLRTDCEGPLLLPYVANLTDPDDWNALFTEVLVAALAVKIAIPLTHKTGMLQVAQQAYATAVETAIDVNAVMRAGKLYQQSWAAARGDTRHWRA